MNSQSALVYKGEKLTYQDLPAMTKEISRIVEKLPQPIFLDIPKGTQLVLWILACLDSKKSFCILDTTNQQRKDWITSTFTVGSIITPTSIIKRADEDLTNTYIVFTSGTTGTPKGVVCYQDALQACIHQQAKLLAGMKNAAWFLNPAFDASLSDILVPLALGATLHIPHMELTSIKSVTKYLYENEVDYIDLPPRFLNILTPDKLPRIKKLLIGGEPASEEATNIWRQEAELWNSYGPTETTVSSSMCKIDKPWTRPWIGQPLLGSHYTVQNGELLITGRLAKEYWRQPELTRERFIVKDNQRYFATGDLVESDENGYYYIGRKDRQMKINGILVCPEEIEQYLSPIEAVVVNANGKLIIATTNAKATKLMLSKTKFPKGKIIEVKEIPRTQSGKPAIQKVINLCNMQ